MMANKFYFVVRLLIGGVFLLSGFMKLTQPFQNFQYVLQEYQIFSVVLENLIARTFPWIEFFLGVFLFLGLWTKWALKGSFLMFSAFLIVLTQALIRGLPVTECGCFGEAFSLPLPGMIVFDGAMFFLTSVLMENENKTALFSLDNYFNGQPETL